MSKARVAQAAIVRAHLAMSKHIEEFSKHCEIVLVMSSQEDDDFVDEVVKVVRKMTGLPIRISLRRDVGPYETPEREA